MRSPVFGSPPETEGASEQRVAETVTMTSSLHSTHTADGLEHLRTGLEWTSEDWRRTSSISVRVAVDADSRCSSQHLHTHSLGHDVRSQLVNILNPKDRSNARRSFRSSTAGVSSVITPCMVHTCCVLLYAEQCSRLLGKTRKCWSLVNHKCAIASFKQVQSN